MTTPRDHGNTVDLQSSPYHLLKRAAQYAANLYLEGAGKTGLTQRQFTVLLSVSENEGINQTTLVKITGIDRSTLADLVSRLGSQGYLQRRRTKADGRTNEIKLTPAGRRALESVLPDAGDVDEKLLSVVPKSQRRPFLSALKAIAAQLEDTDDMDEKTPPANGRRTPKAKSRK